MTGPALFPWISTAVPLIGVLAGRMLHQDPPQLKKSCLVWSVLSLAPITASGVAVPEGPLLLYLLPIAAVISLLGQPTHKDHRSSWLMTLVYLGCGIGVIIHHGLFSHLFLLALLATTISLLVHHHTTLWPISWWGISLFGLACVGVIIAAFTDPPTSSSAAFLTCVVLIPLLPGNLPSFAAVLLPAVGLHFMVTMLPTLPVTITGFVSLFALAGALYGAVKAMAQTRIRLMLAYGSLSFFSVLWWFAAASHLATSRAALLVASVSFATCGLLIAWQIIRTRYGDDVDPQSISGLASSMPSYGVLLSLLALAAMGLPPFGVFAGFMGLLLHSPIPSLLGLLIILAAWLAASWYIMSAVQRLLFGMKRTNIRHHDVVPGEWGALVLTILVLVVLGLTPNDWFSSPMATQAVDTFSRGILWQR
jgi:NADH-quinone oxidoreductase subunit M